VSCSEDPVVTKHRKLPMICVRRRPSRAFLINGGAATAVLTLLSSDHVDAEIVRNVPWALGGYAVGVALSAIMLFCIMMMADYWNYFWYHWSYLGNKDDAEASEIIANRWHWAFYVSFAFTIVLFLGSSIFIAVAITASKLT
jgi:hypothetical protein